MALEIKGLQKTTLLDYPGKLAAVIFLGGCNFRCAYCFNPDLVLHPENLPTISEEEIFAFLKERKKWLDAVVVSGGEPTMHKELPELLRKIKALGYLVKLDTNGTNPKMIEELLKEKLLDFIAMDIKAPLEKYEKAACTPVDKEAIKKSARLIIESGTDYEFRTTAVQGLFSKEDAIAVGKWLKGARHYSIQQFRNSQPMVGSRMQNVPPYSESELKEIAEAARPFFGKVEVKNL